MHHAAATFATLDSFLFRPNFTMIPGGPGTYSMGSYPLFWELESSSPELEHIGCSSCQSPAGALEPGVMGIMVIMMM